MLHLLRAMSTWRYVKNGQSSDPLDTSALQALLSNGSVAPDTLVWKEGMANWVAAHDVPELASAIPPKSNIPPIPPGIGAPPPRPPINSDTADIEQNKIFAVFAYFGILFLVPLLAAPNSKFARFHANQGLVLFLVSLALGFGYAVIAAVLMHIPFIGHLVALTLSVMPMAVVVFMILGVINAASGHFKQLPLIGHLQILKQ
jgi:uncharacterized membrane protein